MFHGARVTVVIPCYKVKKHILGVITKIPSWIDHVIIVDDGCPESTGDHVSNNFDVSNITVLKHTVNAGVGAAMTTGYLHAIAQGADIVVKIDGDDQMDTKHLPDLLLPLVIGMADYAKGNRFSSISSLRSMPRGRLIGNAVLSFASKLSTGYWNVMDPTNGFTAIAKEALQSVDFSKVSRRYFFESDMLFQLGIRNYVVVDVPMEAVYGSEKSNLVFSQNALSFAYRHAANTLTRLFLIYFLQSFSVISILLTVAFMLTIFIIPFSLYNWWWYSSRGLLTPTGTVVLSAFTLHIAVQMFLTFITFDIQRTPRPTDSSRHLETQRTRRFQLTAGTQVTGSVRGTAE